MNFFVFFGVMTYGHPGIWKSFAVFVSGQPWYQPTMMRLYGHPGVWTNSGFGAAMMLTHWTFFVFGCLFRILGIAGLEWDNFPKLIRTDVQSWPPTAAVVMSKIVLIATGTSSNYVVYILPNAVLKSWKQTNLVISPEYHAKNGRRRT